MSLSVLTLVMGFSLVGRAGCGGLEGVTAGGGRGWSWLRGVRRNRCSAWRRCYIDVISATGKVEAINQTASGSSRSDLAVQHAESLSAHKLHLA